MQRLWRWAGTLLLMAAITVWIVDFRPSSLGRRLPSDLGDPLFNLVLLDWGSRSIAHGLDGFWDANFFFPAKRVMTLSDHLLGPAAMTALLRVVWDNPLAAYNLLYLGSFVLSGFTVAWVLHRSGASRTAATLGGIMFAFSPYRADQRAHIQVLIVQWAPLVLWYWDRLLARPGLRPAACFVLFYVLHVSGGNYLAYLIHFALGILLLQHVRGWRALLAWRSLRAIVPATALAGAVSVAIYLPYVEAREEHRIERTEAQVKAFGATPRSYFSSDGTNRIWGKRLPNGRGENRLFSGALPMLFAGAGLLRLARRRNAGAEHSIAIEGSGSARPTTTFERGVLWSGLFCLALSFAPVFLAMARVVPGLASMRVPTRVYPFISLALVVLAARGIDWAREAISPRRRAALAMTVGLLLCVELDSRTEWIGWPPRYANRDIFREIGRRPEVKAVLHLPIHADAREAIYMYWSTLDWKPIANGYSGYVPATFVELHRRMTEKPLATATMDRLSELGITHVALHPRLFPLTKRHRLQSWERHWRSGDAPRIRLVASSRTDRLYELLPAVAAEPATAPVAEEAPPIDQLEPDGD